MIRETMIIPCFYLFIHLFNLYLYYYLYLFIYFYFHYLYTARVLQNILGAGWRVGVDDKEKKNDI